MASEHILRLPRTDSVGDYILVNVISNGPSPLDVKLLATEGDSPYIAEIKQRRIAKLRDHRNRLSDSEWETTLLAALTQRRVQKSEADHLERLEVIATVAGGSLVITFRHNISGITQKLGDIVLKQDDEQELELLNWAGIAVQRSNSLEDEVQDLTAKYEEQSRTMEKLNKQLEDLIVAKKEHEDALLEKFRELLNTKKLKIRDQQRLLAGAKLDPKQAAKLQSARAEKGHKPSASRAGKRKANGVAPVEESSDDDSFEPGPPTQRKEESDGSEQDKTPEASDQDVTEDESDDDLDSVSRSPALLDRHKRGDSADGKPQEEMRLDTPPPRRELPFGKPDGGARREQVKESAREDRSTLNQEAGNEDEETDDDEL
ncbi:DNA-repair protein XRCC4, partial [Lecanoromycetidae sp. Uapishka_2]